MDAGVLCAPDHRLVIAHRGGAGRAPENTLAAFTRSASLGAEAIELDVRLSRDGEVVVIHDATVDRTTDARGRVADRTAAELGRLDAGHRFTPDGGASFPFRGEGIGVPRLADVIAAVPTLPLLIEVKEPEALRPVTELLQRLDATGRSVVASAVFAGVAPARGGGLRTGASTRDAARLLFAPHAPKKLPYEALCIPPRHWGIPLPVGWLARRARACGTATHVWTVNDPAVARRLWASGVAGIVTDVPDVVAAALNRR